MKTHRHFILRVYHTFVELYHQYNIQSYVFFCKTEDTYVINRLKQQQIIKFKDIELVTLPW